MANKSEYVVKTVLITVTREEIEQLLIEKYANLGLVSVPEVEFTVSEGCVVDVVIEYVIHQPVDISEV